MSIELTTTKGYCHAQINGDMTIYTAAEYWQALLKKGHGDQGMEVDLESVAEIDSSGVQLLLALKNHLQGTKQGLSLSNPSECVRDALELTHLAEEFKIEITETAK